MRSTDTLKEESEARAPAGTGAHARAEIVHLLARHDHMQSEFDDRTTAGRGRFVVRQCVSAGPLELAAEPPSHDQKCLHRIKSCEFALICLSEKFSMHNMRRFEVHRQRCDQRASCNRGYLLCWCACVSRPRPVPVGSSTLTIATSSDSFFGIVHYISLYGPRVAVSWLKRLSLSCREWL